MALDKIQVSTTKVPELVMNSLLEAIESGEIKVNEDLPPERELAETLGVGRGSLRECLAVLEFMGVIESRGNRKAVVKNAESFQKAISFIRLSEKTDTFVDFMEFRRNTEVAIVRLACRRATEEDLKILQADVDRLATDPSDFQADVDFHLNMARASHNVIFASVLDYVNDMILDLRMRYFARPDYHDKTVRAHGRILEAVVERDERQATMEMDHHLSIIEEYYRDEKFGNDK
ncbi:MAG: FadR family transcriptional regulator [Clostridia bacterium]|nr:FadR family transcriptional regulator [Clostridia bacterium]NCC68389.1 FadR family transcriptional regulator [Clostridia bacterium]